MIPHLSRQGFNAIFKEAMTIDICHVYSIDQETGQCIHDSFDVVPKIIIRPFGRNATELDFCDSESSWLFYKKLKRCRIMDASGNVYYDNY